MSPVRLDNPIKDYDWGSTVAIQRLIGHEPDGTPMAELWLGAHPNSPSRLSGGENLDDVVRANPESSLGAEVLGEFGARLPFLLKVLAADRALSLQVHPDAKQAAEAFEAEQGSEAIEKYFADRWHKPEMGFALDEVRALAGFRPTEEAADALDALGTAFSQRAAEILREQGPIEAMRFILEYPDAAATLEAIPGSANHSRAHQLAAELAEQFPGDAGVIVSLIMNEVVLQPGDAMYIPAHALHAYIKGIVVEAMAASDNVLRAGMTSKPVNVDLLLETVHNIAPIPLEGAEVPGAGSIVHFETPANEFALTIGTLADEATDRLPAVGPRILLVLDGQISVSASSGVVELSHGESAWIPHSDGPIEVTGTGKFALASCPVAI